MKKITVTILMAVMCVLMTACGGGNKNAVEVSESAVDGSKVAFEVSKVAYDNIDIAYEITEKFGSDLYEAWRLGIYEDDEILDDGVAHLAKELSLSEDELKDGLAYSIAQLTNTDWSELSDEDKATLVENADIFFDMVEDDDLFTFCVSIVVGAYTVNGKVEEAQNALDTAKSQMKELSEKYSDYEHYPTLKEYYTTTSSFFDFCQNPTGSFEQVKDTINDYKNRARDYINDLDYIFE